MGTIRTYQRCPKCGERFPSSKGEFPIICNDCRTQPTKYFISVWWKGKHECIYHDSAGKTIHDWSHACAVIGDVRSRIAAHKDGRGFFNPEAYRRNSSTSFDAFWKRFLEQYNDSTLAKIKSIGKHHLTYFAEFQMRDITSWHIREWWLQLRKKGLSNGYLNDIQTWLRTFFGDAHDLDVIEKYPKFPDMLTLPPPEVDEWLTEEEQLLILDNIPKHDRPIFDFLFLTGVRVNEACALRRQDIDHKHGIVIIQNTVKRDGSVGIVKNKKPRRIPLQAVAECLKSDVISIDYVFINKWGRRYSDDYLRDKFYAACDKAKIKRIKLKNATRHSFGMGLVNKGYDAWQVSKAMGHSDLKITEHYIKMQDTEIAGMYGRVGKRKTGGP